MDDRHAGDVYRTLRTNIGSQFLFSLSALKRKTNPSGLTAIGVHAEGFSVAHVERGDQGRPRLSACQFVACEPQERTKQLARLVSQYRLKRTPCTTVLDTADYQLLLTEAPDVQPDELKAAIRWRIKDLINFHINDATLDVFDLPGEATPGRVREMYAVAVQNKAVQQRVDLMDAAGVQLEVIDIPEMAQRNIAALLPEDENGVAMVSFQANGGLITLTRGGELFLTRSMNVGLEALQRGENSSVYFDQIVLELQRSLDYFESHFRLAPIRRVVVAPTPFEIPGLTEYLSTNLNAQATALDITQLMDCPADLPRPLQSACFVTIGAALRQEVKAL